MYKKSCIPQVNDIGLRFFSDETLETPLCQGSHKIIVPKAARNTKEEWKFIVNLENYTQTLDVEECRNSSRNGRDFNKEFGYCTYSGTDGRVPEKTNCRQLFRTHRLVTIDEFGELEEDEFEFPSACACFFRRDFINSLPELRSAPFQRN